MKTEKEILEALHDAMTNAIRSDSFEALRFFQGQINILEWFFAKPEERQDGFTEQEKKDES